MFRIYQKIDTLLNSIYKWDQSCQKTRLDLTFLKNANFIVTGLQMTFTKMMIQS